MKEQIANFSLYRFSDEVTHECLGCSGTFQVVNNAPTARLSRGKQNENPKDGGMCSVLGDFECRS